MNQLSKTISTALLGLVILSTTVATAQPVLMPIRPSAMDPDAAAKLRITPTSAESRAVTRGQTGSAPVAASTPLTGAAALSQFRLSFENGDHPLRRFGVAKRSDGTADLILSDSNGDDPYNAYATWQIIPGGIGGEVTTQITSGGIFQMPVPPGPVGHRLVLGGFMISNGGFTSIVESGDTQIESLSINAHDGFPLPSTNPQSSISGSIRTNGGSRPIRVTVQYVWIPSSFITMASSARNDSPSMGRPSGAVRLLSVARGQVPETDKYVIKSFAFEYLNGTHNLLSLGVHLNGATISGRNNDAVSFQDNNVDDPIQWNVAFYRVN
jgi:hypothetical protein